jgi:hypothetical protein
MMTSNGVYLAHPNRLLQLMALEMDPTGSPSIGREHSMTTIHADALQPGDVVDYHGHPHRVTHIDRRNGWAWPVAFDDAGWAMALGHDLVTVHRAA